MTYETLNPSATQARMNAEDWVFVDVRTVEEFDQGHVPGAWNIPFAFRDPGAGMVPNPDFVAVMKGHFTFESRLVLG
jgi:rhodanese-related sulfurtransferase